MTASAPTAGETAMTLLTIASDDRNAGDGLGALLDATFRHDLEAQGAPGLQIDHLVRVNAKLAGAAAILLRVYAHAIGVNPERVLEQLAMTETMSGG